MNFRQNYEISIVIRTFPYCFSFIIKLSAEFSPHIQLPRGSDWHFAEYSHDIPLPGPRRGHFAEYQSKITLYGTQIGHSADFRIYFPPPYRERTPRERRWTRKKQMAGIGGAAKARGVKEYRIFF